MLTPGRDRARNVIDVGYNADEIVRAIRTHLSNGRYPSSALYGDGKAGERIAHILGRIPLTVEKRMAY